MEFLMLITTLSVSVFFSVKYGRKVSRLFSDNTGTLPVFRFIALALVYVSIFLVSMMVVGILMRMLASAPLVMFFIFAAIAYFVMKAVKQRRAR